MCYYQVDVKKWLAMGCGAFGFLLGAMAVAHATEVWREPVPPWARPTERIEIPDLTQMSQMSPSAVGKWYAMRTQPELREEGWLEVFLKLHPITPENLRALHESPIARRALAELLKRAPPKVLGNLMALLSRLNVVQDLEHLLVNVNLLRKVRGLHALLDNQKHELKISEILYKLQIAAAFHERGMLGLEQGALSVSPNPADPAWIVEQGQEKLLITESIGRNGYFPSVQEAVAWFRSASARWRKPGVWVVHPEIGNPLLREIHHNRNLPLEVYVLPRHTSILEKVFPAGNAAAPRAPLAADATSSEQTLASDEYFTSILARLPPRIRERFEKHSVNKIPEVEALLTQAYPFTRELIENHSLVYRVLASLVQNPRFMKAHGWRLLQILKNSDLTRDIPEILLCLEVLRYRYNLGGLMNKLAMSMNAKDSQGLAFELRVLVGHALQGELVSLPRAYSTSEIDGYPVTSLKTGETEFDGLAHDGTRHLVIEAKIVGSNHGEITLLQVERGLRKILRNYKFTKLAQRLVLGIDGQYVTDAHLAPMREKVIAFANQQKILPFEVKILPTSVLELLDFYSRKRDLPVIQSQQSAPWSNDPMARLNLSASRPFYKSDRMSRPAVDYSQWLWRTTLGGRRLRGNFR